MHCLIVTFLGLSIVKWPRTVWYHEASDSTTMRMPRKVVEPDQAGTITFKAESEGLVDAAPTLRCEKD